MLNFLFLLIQVLITYSVFSFLGVPYSLNLTFTGIIFVFLILWNLYLYLKNIHVYAFDKFYDYKRLNLLEDNGVFIIKDLSQIKENYFYNVGVNIFELKGSIVYKNNVFVYESNKQVLLIGKIGSKNPDLVIKIEELNQAVKVLWIIINKLKK